MTSVPFDQLMQDSETVGTPVPAGKYPALIESCTFGTAKNGRDPQWKIHWRIQGGPHNNRRVLDQQTLPLGGPGDDHDKIRLRRGFFFRDMAVLGFDQAFFMSNPDPNVISQMAQGRAAMIDVTVNGSYNNVNGYEQLQGGQGMPAQAQPQPGGFQPPQAQQAPAQPMQTGFQPAAQQQFQPAAAQQFQQPAAAAQPSVMGQQPQPAQQGYPPQQMQQAVGEPQNATQTPAYQQAGGPQAQPGLGQQPAQQAPAPQPAQPGQAVDPNTGQPLTQAPPAPF